MPYPECDCTVCRSHHLYQQATALEDNDPQNGLYLLIHAVAQSAAGMGVTHQDFAIMTQEAFLAHAENFATLDTSKGRMN